MKFWNLNVKRGADGGKHLDIQLHGVIDGGWMDDEGVETPKLIAEMQQHLDAKTVGVRINSIGGSVFGGVALYNALQSHPGEVTCCIEGIAASIASIVSMAGKTVMGKGTMMMIHAPSTVSMGNATELRKTADVLDKVQDALAEIYKAKTGKSTDEINDLIDDETWMTADDAVAAGFADEVMPDVKTDYGPGEQVPAEQNDRAPTLTAEGLRWGGVLFPAASLPQQILAMAKPVPPAIVPPAPPVLAIVPPPVAAAPPPVIALEPVLARADLDRRAPELVKALLEEGRAAGAAAERARIKDIDDLDVKGCAEMVAAAKYGDKPSDASALAVAVVKAGKAAGSDLLAIRLKESEALAAITTGAPDNTAGAQEARLIKAMVDGGNARRGGDVR